MSDPIIPPEFLEQAVKFAEPQVVIESTFPGVQLPPILRAQARGGTLFIPLSPNVTQHIRWFATWFEMDLGTEHAYIPGGAIKGVWDAATGEMITMRKELLRELH